MATIQKITPFLWFDQQAEEAANFYVSVFNNSKVENVVRNGDAVMVASFSLDGQKVSALNGGPMFKFNPSVSFYVVCDSIEETDTIWHKLLEGGKVMIPLERQEWSEKYGWLEDRFGLSWQIGKGNLSDLGQRFTPSLLFTAAQQGRAEEAVRFYTALFPNASIDTIIPYGPEGPGKEGNVMYAQFRLQGETFIAMDNPMAVSYTFNEAFSFVVHCAAQEEVDFYWNKLTADGGAESQCGWLKDKFGLSWQIVPEALPKLLSDPDPAKAQRAMTALSQMKKIEIDKLTWDPAARKPITVENTINAPVEKVWELWTKPEHIMNWNSASDDWHTPKAENDLRTGGKFRSTMAARDGSVSFEFGGVYDEVIPQERIAYTMEDGRKVVVTFDAQNGKTHVSETFDMENMNSEELQRGGWQAILDNFKKYAE